MPWRQVYEPAPKNERLPILENLPNGVEEKSFSLSAIREAWGHPTPETFASYYHCYRCGGWIEGQPNSYQVNTLNPAMLAGRQGTEYYCRRCGEQIGFDGLMS